MEHWMGSGFVEGGVGVGSLVETSGMFKLVKVETKPSELFQKKTMSCSQNGFVS